MLTGSRCPFISSISADLFVLLIHFIFLFSVLSFVCFSILNVFSFGVFFLSCLSCTLCFFLQINTMTIVINQQMRNVTITNTFKYHYNEFVVFFCLPYPPLMSVHVLNYSTSTKFTAKTQNAI